MPCFKFLKLPISLDPPQNSSWIFCCCHTHGDSLVIVVQNHTLHALQHAIDGADVRVGQRKVQDVGLGGSSVNGFRLLGPLS